MRLGLVDGIKEKLQVRCMSKCCLLFMYFVFLDHICLNMLLWSALVVVISAAILFSVRHSPGIASSGIANCKT